MSNHPAIHARTALECATTLVGIELVCGAQVIEFVDDDLELGTGTGTAYDAVPEMVPELTEDRPVNEDIERAEAVVRTDEFIGLIARALDKSLACESADVTRRS